MMKFNHPAVVRPLSTKAGKGYLREFVASPGCIADGSIAAILLAENLEHFLHQK